MIKHIPILLILLSGLYSLENGYFIYKFSIDNNDNISLHSSKYIDAKLKIPKIEKHIHDAFTYKLKDDNNGLKIRINELEDKLKKGETVRW